MIWVLMLLLVVLAMPFVVEYLRQPMSARAREEAPGQFAELSKGTIHYRWHGPATGPVAVCVHGLSTPSFVFDGLAERLVERGYRVLVYDHYGRGYSDRPKGVQDDTFFLGLLTELLDHEKVEGDLAVIGYSMGGAIATSFAAAYPDRVKRLILIASAGTAVIQNRQLKFIMRTPVLGDALMLALYPRVLRAGIAAEQDLPTSVPGITDLQLAEQRYRGYFPAMLASLRGILSTPLEAEHRAIAAASLPTLAIWGDADDVIPDQAAERLRALNPDAEQSTIAGAGHGVTYTHTDQIIAAFDRWVS